MKNFYKYLSISFLFLSFLSLTEIVHAAPTNVNTVIPTTAAPTPAVPNQAMEEKEDNYVEAQVLRIKETTEVITAEDADFNGALKGEQKRITQQLEVKVIGKGPFKDKTYSTLNTLAGRAKDMLLKVGDTVLLDVVKEKVSGKVETMVVDYYRAPVMWIMIIAFLIALIAFGGRKGVAAVVGLCTTFAMIFFVFIPYIMKGGNPMWLAIGSSILITFLVHLFVGGISPKSISSTAGTAGGMLVAGLFASIASGFAHLKGLSSEDAVNLFLKNPNLDFHGIFLAGIVIGSLGAVMDIGISISSAISEVKAHAPNATFKQLFDAGMNIGKDTIGTMSNTLVLAYAGSALPLMIFIMMNADNVGMAIGYDFIADEILKSIAGAFGLLVTIPITAYISAYLEIRAASKKTS